MRVCVVLSIALLASCAAETRHFRGVDPVRVTVDGSGFDIRLRGNLGEAVRVNPQYAPRLGPLRARAGFAMEQVSGCTVTGVLGDQAVMTGILDCDNQSMAPVKARYSCQDVRQWLKQGGESAYPAYGCTPKP